MVLTRMHVITARSQLMLVIVQVGLEPAFPI